MKFSLNKTSIYYKQIFGPKFFKKGLFGKLCDKLAEFPLKDEYPGIEGLYLSGDRYFRTIQFSDARNVPQSEIDQVTSIMPVIKSGLTPYELVRNYCEIIIPVGDRDFGELEDTVNRVQDYFSDTFHGGLYSELELCTRGSCNKHSANEVYKKLLSELPSGTYQFQVDIDGDITEGEVTLPVNPNEQNHLDLMNRIRDANNMQYGMKLESTAGKQQNICVLEHVNMDFLEASLYSNYSAGFLAMLKFFEEYGGQVRKFPKKITKMGIKKAEELQIA
ncbi:MAG: hypothetical protein GY777_19895 [Candidatus Brocadiaceae bacterium]|nr:hypothetical protein [Candidatus Brocadiaceae bacterium]